MKSFVIVASVVAVVAAGAAGLAISDEFHPEDEIPTEQRSLILDEAKAKNVIEHYGLRSTTLFESDRSYFVDRNVFVEYGGSCPLHGPGCESSDQGYANLYIEYRHPEYWRALAIERIARPYINTILVECDPC